MSDVFTGIKSVLDSCEESSHGCIADSQGGIVYGCSHLQPVCAHSAKGMTSYATTMFRLGVSIGCCTFDLRSGQANRDPQNMCSS